MPFASYNISSSRRVEKPTFFWIRCTSQVSYCSSHFKQTRISEVNIRANWEVGHTQETSIWDFPALEKNEQANDVYQNDPFFEKRSNQK
jgi:hypothetical protein